jgi:hypothetical protein
MKRPGCEYTYVLPSHAPQRVYNEYQGRHQREVTRYVKPRHLLRALRSAVEPRGV